jgi:SAM-dependent methyltransferase
MMELKNTGERLIINEYFSNREEYLIYLEHLTTYKFSINYIKDKKVLDFGCGSGYGTALISKYCSQAIGVDISSDAIAYAKETNHNSKLSFFEIREVEKSPLPFPDASFDTVLSFQVIEHIKDPQVYIEEIYRVLKPGGQIIIATPEREKRLFSFQKSWNVWHVKEYSKKQLYELLNEHFSNVKMLELGGREDVLALELKRTNKLKWITLPITLPFTPEFIRKSGLRFLKLINQKLSMKNQNNVKTQFDFGENVISISDNEKMCIGLIAIAQK